MGGVHKDKHLNQQPPKRSPTHLLRPRPNVGHVVEEFRELEERVGGVVHHRHERPDAREVVHVGAAEEGQRGDVVDDVLFEVFALGLDAQVDRLVHLLLFFGGRAGHARGSGLEQTCTHTTHLAVVRAHTQTRTHVRRCQSPPCSTSVLPWAPPLGGSWPSRAAGSCVLCLWFGVVVGRG